MGRRQNRLKLHYGDGILPSNNTGGNSASLLPQYRSELDLLRSHDLTAGEVARASSSTFRPHDDVVFDMLHDQVFLGMVASGSCPVKAIPCLIEDLSALGVRYLYFSPRNMRRTKVDIVHVCYSLFYHYI